MAPVDVDAYGERLAGERLGLVETAVLPDQPRQLDHRAGREVVAVAEEATSHLERLSHQRLRLVERAPLASDPAERRENGGDVGVTFAVELLLPGEGDAGERVGAGVVAEAEEGARHGVEHVRLDLGAIAEPAGTDRPELEEFARGHGRAGGLQRVARLEEFDEEVREFFGLDARAPRGPPATRSRRRRRRRAGR